jgi:hypothetical protein
VSEVNANPTTSALTTKLASTTRVSTLAQLQDNAVPTRSAKPKTISLFALARKEHLVTL